MNKRKLEKLAFQNRRTVRIKVGHNSITEPNFYTSCYCLKPATTHNMLTISSRDFKPLYDKKCESFFICLQHGVNEFAQAGCEFCVPFEKFKFSFVVHSRFAFYTFPPPIIYNGKNMNYFKTFINLANDNFNWVTEKACQFHQNKEVTYHINFANGNFKHGSLRGMTSSKTSMLRNKILGFHTNGIRATLTIDCTLSPHHFILPQSIFDNLNVACPMFFVNRAPSLKNTCLYVLEAFRNKDPHDFTIHINGFLTQGLHADQDGDELTIFFIKYTVTEPSIDIIMTICEMKRMSWKYGTRHDLAYTPRYHFTQYHKYILFTHDVFFREHSVLWKSLNGDPQQKCEQIMHLGCSILRKEVDEFIELLLNFVAHLEPQMVGVHDLLNGVGAVQDVVDSGAKGSQHHIAEYLRNIYEVNVNNKKNLIDGFNKNITSSMLMGIEGARQFALLYTVNPLSLHQNNIYYNRMILLSNIRYASCMASFYYNSFAVMYTVTEIVNDTHKFFDISETEIQKHMHYYSSL